MSKFETDYGGEALNLKDVKISLQTSSTWGTRLSQLARIKGKITICTYSLTNLSGIKEILDKCQYPQNVTLICNKQFAAEANVLMETYPDMKIKLKSDMHAKMVLIEPETVWLSSENFGKKGGFFESTIGIHSKEVYDYYYDRIMQYLNKTC